MAIVAQGFTGRESRHELENRADEAFAQLYPHEMYEVYPVEMIAAVNRIRQRKGLGLGSRWDIESALRLTEEIADARVLSSAPGTDR